MSNIARMAAYAAAFEKSFETDDWSLVRDFFAEDAVYDAGSDRFLGGRFDGRDAILRYFKAVLDGFDRRFESRELALIEGPVEEGQTVRFRGSATYRASGVPDLMLVLDEIITYREGLIVHLEDRYDETMKRELDAYLDAHGEALGVQLGP